MKASAIALLSQWYVNNCHDRWEHTHGISIVTLDNPGWSVDIAIHGTALEKKLFETAKLERSDVDWLVCRVEGRGSGRVFRADCGVGNLEEVLDVFLVWAGVNGH